MQVARRGAPVQAREIVLLKSVVGVSCRLKEAVWPTETEAEDESCGEKSIAILQNINIGVGDFAVGSATYGDS